MATERTTIMVDTRAKAALETAINANSILNIRNSADSPFSVELRRTSDGVVTHWGCYWLMSARQQTEFDKILITLGLDGDRNSIRTGNRVSTWTDREKSFDETLPDVVRKRNALERVPVVWP